MTLEELDKLYRDMTWTQRCNAEVNFNKLFGKTITEIHGAEEGSYEIYFVCSDGSIYLMYHEQDCCENVSVEDICGDVTNLIGRPLTKAEEISNAPDLGQLDFWDDSYTWTWYQLATVRGYVTIRWYGTSNGYYSESVDFMELRPPVDQDVEHQQLNGRTDASPTLKATENLRLGFTDISAKINTPRDYPFDESNIIEI